MLHCQFACFFYLVVGCAEMGFKIDPILLDWVHLIPGFYCIMELSRLVYYGVYGVCCFNVGVWISN